MVDSGHAHEDDERTTTVIPRKFDLFALSADPSADHERFCGTALGDWDTGEDGACEGGGDAWDDDGFEAMFTEVKDFFACTSVYGRVALFELSSDS